MGEGIITIAYYAFLVAFWGSVFVTAKSLSQGRFSIRDLLCFTALVALAAAAVATLIAADPPA